MPLFEVLTPRDSIDPLNTQLIRHRFSWGAALLPPVWAIFHGLWLEAFGWVAGAALIMALAFFAGADAGFWLYLLFAAWFGWSAADLRIAALKRGGYREAAMLVAEDEMLAERDFLLETTR